MNTYGSDKKAVEEVELKVRRLAANAEAGTAPAGDLRAWLDKVYPKHCKRMVDLGVVGHAQAVAGKLLAEYIEDYLDHCRFLGATNPTLKTCARS